MTRPCLSLPQTAGTSPRTLTDLELHHRLHLSAEPVVESTRSPRLRLRARGRLQSLPSQSAEDCLNSTGQHRHTFCIAARISSRHPWPKSPLISTSESAGSASMWRDPYLHSIDSCSQCQPQHCGSRLSHAWTRICCPASHELAAILLDLSLLQSPSYTRDLGASALLGF